MINKIVLFLFAAFLITACKEEAKAPLTKGEKPAAIEEFSVENLAGAAKIMYKIPDNQVAYVVAEYETKKGLKRESRSSKYKSTLHVEGFPKADEYEVTLYAVGRNEQRSEPIVIKVNPLKPPVLEAFETLSLGSDFGGAKVLGKNIFESDLVVEVIILDEKNEWKTYEQYYSNSKDIKFSARGLTTEKRKFGVYIRDRWLNYSDTLFAELSPYFEEQIDMSNFVETNLPGDQWENHQVGSSRSIKRLFDGLRGSQAQGYYSVLNSGMPQHFTIDLRDVYQLSRLKYWQHVSNTVSFGSANVKKFRVWGSLDPNLDGSFDDSWTLLGEFENIKPSGLPIGTNSAEDMEQVRAGEEYSFELEAPAVRYIRFQTLETWGKTQHVYITEMEFWGSKVN